MQRFFNDFESLDCFTLSLDGFADKLQCPHCARSKQLVSHGVIYKQRSIECREPVGKRVFCSNRDQRSGCGRTVQLYVKQVIPSLKYGAAQVFVFLASLLLNLSVKGAYQAATGSFDARNGWRWLTRMEQNLTDYRCAVSSPHQQQGDDLKPRSRRLALILTTIKALFAISATCPCADYQLAYQKAFLQPAKPSIQPI